MHWKCTNQKIKALVVDDSTFMGMQIAGILGDDEQIEVVGRARSGLEALRMVEELNPDVVTMDLEMPAMDGITALKNVMVKHPVPVVVISSFAHEATKTSFDALLYGAVDVIAKPSLQETASLESQRSDIVSRVKRAASIEARRCRVRRWAVPDSVSFQKVRELADSSTRYVCVAAWAGGYYAMLRLVTSLDGSFDDVIIGMIPALPRHVEQFARYLSAHCAIAVENLRTTESMHKGTCYLCSSRDTLLLRGHGDGTLKAEFAGRGGDFPPELVIDTVFRDLASIVAERAIGVVIANDDDDRFDSLAAIRNAGGLGVVKSVADCMDHGALVALMNAGSVLEQGSPECEPFQELQEDELVEANDSPSDAEASDFGQAVALRDSFYGYVAGIDIIEYLQFVLLTGKPVVVEVCSPCGAVGQIYARNGRVLHAHCGDVQGEQALYKCLGFRGGSFTNRPWREPARVSINQQGDLILMEAVHRKDEAQSSSGLTHGHPAHEFRSRAVTSCHGTWPD